MLKSFSKAHEAEWLGKYAEILTNYNADDDDDRDRAERDADCQSEDVSDRLAHSASAALRLELDIVVEHDGKHAGVVDSMAWVRAVSAHAVLLSRVLESEPTAGLRSLAR